MKKSAFLLAGAVSALALSSPASAATYTYVGSWQVYDPAAPVWFGSPPNGPLAYTGQEAAALLFGGLASQYAISTVDSSVANIDHLAWYDVIGVGGTMFSEGYNNKYLGQYYGPTSGYNCCGAGFASINAASAFVRDNFVTGVNYAFISVAPEPATWAMMLLGIGAIGLTMRRRSQQAARVSYAF